MRVIIFAAAVIAWSCSPVKITRIGPPLVPQNEDCEVQIFEEGDLPNRPNRDVGMVRPVGRPAFGSPLTANRALDLVFENVAANAQSIEPPPNAPARRNLPPITLQKMLTMSGFNDRKSADITRPPIDAGTA